MKRVMLLAPIGSASASGAYMLIYLYRWQWNRAIIAGLFFVASLVVIATLLVLDRLRRLDAKVTSLAEEVRDQGSERVLQILREEAPPARRHFAWLRNSTTHTNVFLPVLLGAGVVASAAAWLVEHLARVVTVPLFERRLADRLTVIGVPEGGLLVDPSPRPTPVRHPSIVVASIVVLVAAIGVATAGLDYVADRIQGRPETLDPQVQTIVDVELRGTVANERPETTVRQLWTVCTGPGVFSDRALPAPTVQAAPSGVFRLIVPADVGPQGVDRLVGCLNDATLDRVQGHVIEIVRE